jgi:hypothetical protein
VTSKETVHLKARRGNVDGTTRRDRSDPISGEKVERRGSRERVMSLEFYLAGDYLCLNARSVNQTENEELVTSRIYESASSTLSSLRCGARGRLDRKARAVYRRTSGETLAVIS